MKFRDYKISKGPVEIGQHRRMNGRLIKIVSEYKNNYTSSLKEKAWNCLDIRHRRISAVWESSITGNNFF